MLCGFLRLLPLLSQFLFRSSIYLSISLYVAFTPWEKVSKMGEILGENF
jgi:hypothetical protein